MSRGTWVPDKRATVPFAYRAITFCGTTFQKSSARQVVCNSPTAMRSSEVRSRNPGGTTRARLSTNRFRLFPVRSPLLRKSRLFSVPEVTEMFQFTPFASQGLCIHPRDDTVLPYRVAPFGNLRVNAYVQLSEAYRSLSRPSSPIDT